MACVRRAAWLGGVVVGLWVGRVEAAPFIDPAPPVVHPRVEKDVAGASESPALTFHQPPKALAQRSISADWTHLLGPAHNMTSPEAPLLARLPAEGPAVVWEMKKGSGYAASVVGGGRCILFHRVDDKEIVDCLDAESGKRFWSVAYPSAYQDRYGYCDGPRAAPVIDGDRVYSYGAEGVLHCLDLASGHIYWKREILREFKLGQNFFGVGTSPLVEKDLLIVNVGAKGGPCVAAFDKLTGKMRWGAGEKWGPSYATPMPAEIQGKRRVLVFAGGESLPPAGGLLCIDPRNGAVDFEFPWRSRSRESVNASSPVVVGNQVFISECYGRGSVLLDVGADMKGTPAWVAQDFGTHFMTAIYKDGYLYGIHGHGPLDCPLVCIEVKTGKEMWRTEPEWVEELPTKDGPRKHAFSLNRASLLLADGKAICLTEMGHLLYLDLNPQGYKELSRARLFTAGETWTPPVLSGGLLYVNQNEPDRYSGKGARVVCYDLRGE